MNKVFLQKMKKRIFLEFYLQIIKNVVNLHSQNNISSFKIYFAKIAQLVERHLAKVEVAGSNPVFRSIPMLEWWNW